MLHRHQRCKRHNKKLCSVQINFTNLFRLDWAAELLIVNSSQQIIECVTFMMLCSQYFFDVFILARNLQLDVHDILNIALSRRTYFSESISVKDCWESVSTLVDVYEYNGDTKVSLLLLNYIIVVCCWVIRVAERIDLEVWSSLVSVVLERV